MARAICSRYHLKYGNPFNGMIYNGAVRKWLEGIKHAEGKKRKMEGVAA
jgi:hypothetical protein